VVGVKGEGAFAFGADAVLECKSMFELKDVDPLQCGQA